MLGSAQLTRLRAGPSRAVCRALAAHPFPTFSAERSTLDAESPTANAENCASNVRVAIWMLDVERWAFYLAAFRALGPVTKTLFVATLLHALAALVFSNFRFASFFERAHSGFQICEGRFNHLIRRVATHFFTAGLRTIKPLF